MPLMMGVIWLPTSRGEADDLDHTVVGVLRVRLVRAFCLRMA